MPRLKVSTTMAVMSATKASIQSVFAMFTALPESERPISMMTGPITTGGNMRSRNRLPCHFTRALITK